MKKFFLFLLFLALVGAAAYYFVPEVKDKVNGWFTTVKEEVETSRTTPPEIPAMPDDNDTLSIPKKTRDNITSQISAIRKTLPLKLAYGVYCNSIQFDQDNGVITVVVNVSFASKKTMRDKELQQLTDRVKKEFVTRLPGELRQYIEQGVRLRLVITGFDGDIITTMIFTEDDLK